MWYQALNRSQPYLKTYRRWNMWYDYNNPKHHEIKRLRTTFIEHFGRRLFKHEAYLRFFGAVCFVPFIFFVMKQRSKYKKLKEPEPSVYSSSHLIANIGRNTYGFETRTSKSFEMTLSVVLGGDLLNHILSADSDAFRSEESQDEDAGLSGDFTEEDILDLHREKKHEPHMGIVYRHPHRHFLNEGPNDILSPYKVEGEHLKPTQTIHHHH
jgi:hypothetical protein